MRYFADTYYVNRSVAELGLEPGLADYVTRLHRWGNGFGQLVRFGIPTLNYTNPIVFAKDAAKVPQIGTDGKYVLNADGSKKMVGMKARVWQRDTIAAQQTIGNVGRGGLIPWNPIWTSKSAGGNDSLLTIVDEGAGVFWTLWMVDKAPVWWNYLGSLVSMGKYSEPAVGVGACNRYTSLRSESDNLLIRDRGCGLLKLAGTVTLADLESGSIDHAIGWYSPTPMFGPVNVVPATDWTQPGAGTTKGWYANGGATRLEHQNPVTLSFGGVTTWAADDLHRAMSQPSGIRFAHTRSDESISQWIAERGYVGARASTARIYAVALRDYGFFYGDTCGQGGSSFEFEGANVNPGRVTALGLKVDSTYFDYLLDGLFTEANTVVVRPLT